MVTDASKYITFLESFPRQCREALELPKGMTLSGEYSHIIVCGMGGSAIGGDIVASYLKNKLLPVVVVRDYTLPEFVDKYSLVFVVSYSGNTEETISAYHQAIKKGCTVIAITSGGKLSELCEKKIIIPLGLPPRAALGYLFFPIIGILHNSNLINIMNEELNEMLANIKNVEQYKEQGEDLSKKLRDKIPIIYSSELLYPIAYRFKTQINENSKQAAFCNEFPEMNHNELVGFRSLERKKFIVVFIRDPKDHPKIVKRMDICRDLIENYVEVEEIYTNGNYLLTRIFSTIFLCDFISYYLALYNRVDPTPVEVIEKLKSMLK